MWVPVMEELLKILDEFKGKYPEQSRSINALKNWVYDIEWEATECHYDTLLWCVNEFGKDLAKLRISDADRQRLSESINRFLTEMAQVLVEKCFSR